MSPRHVKSTSKIRVCPECDLENNLKEILYGLPDGPHDPKMIQLGGCCRSENDPDFICESCGWAYQRTNTCTEMNITADFS